MRDSGGFSLIEVLAALFILGVAAAMVLSAFSSNLRLIRKSGDHAGAAIHARSLMEEALAMDDVTKASIDEMELGGPYTGRVEVIRSGDDGNGVEVYDIRVEVTWPPSGSVSLTGRKAVVVRE